MKKNSLLIMLFAFCGVFVDVHGHPTGGGAAKSVDIGALLRANTKFSSQFAQRNGESSESDFDDGKFSDTDRTAAELEIKRNSMQAREARRAEKEASQAGKAVAVQPSSVVERSEAEEIKSPTGVSDVVSAPQGALAAAKKTSLALAALRNRTQAAPERSSFLNAIKDLRKTDANDAEEAQPMSATVEAGPKPEVSGAGRPEMGGLLGGIRSFNRGGLKPVEKKPEEAKSADPVPSAPKATPKGMSTSASNKPQASAGNGKSLAEALEARKKVLDASEKAAKDSAPNATPKITFGDTLKKAVKPSQPAAVDQSITQAAEPARRSTNLFEAFSDDSGFSPLVITVPVDKKLMSASGRKSPTSVADDVSASSADVSPAAVPSSSPVVPALEGNGLDGAVTPVAKPQSNNEWSAGKLGFIGATSIVLAIFAMIPEIADKAARKACIRRVRSLLSADDMTPQERGAAWRTLFATVAGAVGFGISAFAGHRYYKNRNRSEPVQ